MIIRYQKHKLVGLGAMGLIEEICDMAEESNFVKRRLYDLLVEVGDDPDNEEFREFYDSEQNMSESE